ncbi:hypothetical protein [Azospirillum agricola]|uniref:hypothetical protein n=1 Tax=Azospirillum agricola TaxID=1720247 RepID=UPI000A0F2CEC|nr:hypothetical protein [Azospirillum agricola]SMH62561.1 hypothetical protein SAMN02982994_6364 [Azospirillum lipoferum]
MATILTFSEADALIVNPFDGDFGDLGTRRVSDTIITVAEPPRCHTCGGTLTPGTRCRHLVEQAGSEEDGDEPGAIKRTEYRFCQHCCSAMARDAKDGGDRLGSRITRMVQNRERSNG